MELQVSEDKMHELMDFLISTGDPIKLTLESGNKKFELNVVQNGREVSRGEYFQLEYKVSLNMIQNPTPNNSIKG